jgi:DNA-binding MarR family transcriptional regulator
VSIGRMIDRLEARGFVKRTADAQDRRAFRIHLDAAATPLVEQMDDLVAAVSTKARKGIPVDDYAAFLRTLEQMRRNLSQD